MLKMRTENILTYNNNVNITTLRQRTGINNITRQLCPNKKPLPLALALMNTQHLHWCPKDIYQVYRNKRFRTYGLFGSIFGR